MQKNHARVGSLAFILATALFLTPVSAQERCKVNDTGADSTTKYVQQHMMDVGDVPGHQIRIAQLHTTFTAPKPNCEGLKPTESENYISTDYTDRNGNLHGYLVTTYDNGDKIFQRQEGTSQTVTNADGTKSSTLYAVVKYVGGTGKYKSIQGLARTIAAFDPVKNHVDAHTEGEYWIEK